MRSLSEVYFEPLDDNMILSLPLQAPEFLWRAGTAVEWKAARENILSLEPSGQTGVWAVRQPAWALQQLLNYEKAGSLDIHALLPLTRIILACAKIRGAANDSEPWSS